MLRRSDRSVIVAVVAVRMMQVPGNHEVDMVAVRLVGVPRVNAVQVSVVQVVGVTLVLDGNVAASGAVRVGMRGMLFAGQWSPPCWAGAHARQAPSASIRAGVVSPTQALARCGATS